MSVDPGYRILANSRGAHLPAALIVTATETPGPDEDGPMEDDKGRHFCTASSPKGTFRTITPSTTKVSTAEGPLCREARALTRQARSLRCSFVVVEAPDLLLGTADGYVCGSLGRSPCP